MKHIKIIVPNLVSKARQREIERAVDEVIAERKSGKKLSTFSAKSIVMVPNKK